MVTMRAGVRLELDTDSADLELDVLLTLLQVNDRPMKPAAFDLVVDSELVDSVQATGASASASTTSSRPMADPSATADPMPFDPALRMPLARSSPFARTGPVRRRSPDAPCGGPRAVEAKPR